jgi:hypothetical protein
VALASFFLKFHFLEEGIEPLVVTLPEFAIAFEPAGGFGERFWREAAGAALAVAGAGNEAGAFENAKVFRNSGLAHGKRFCEFEDAGFAAGEAREDGAACGIGESGEGGVEAFRLRHCITYRLYNHEVIYKGRSCQAKFCVSLKS